MASDYARVEQKRLYASYFQFTEFWVQWIEHIAVFTAHNDTRYTHRDVRAKKAAAEGLRNGIVRFRIPSFGQTRGRADELVWDVNGDSDELGPCQSMLPCDMGEHLERS